MKRWIHAAERVEAKTSTRDRISYLTERITDLRDFIADCDDPDESIDAQLELAELEEQLNFVDVKKGDVFFIPSGLVHAIGAGILLAEIQQNSNITYRVYDYNRLGKDGKPRELHVKDALNVIVNRTDDEIDKIRFSTNVKNNLDLGSLKFNNLPFLENP